MREKFGSMQLRCSDCNKVVSTIIPKDFLLRAILICPECFGQYKKHYLVATPFFKSKKAELTTAQAIWLIALVFGLLIIISFILTGDLF